MNNEWTLVALELQFCLPVDCKNCTLCIFCAILHVTATILNNIIVVGVCPSPSHLEVVGSNHLAMIRAHLIQVLTHSFSIAQLYIQSRLLNPSMKLFSNLITTMLYLTSQITIFKSWWINMHHNNICRYLRNYINIQKNWIKKKYSWWLLLLSI